MRHAARVPRGGGTAARTAHRTRCSVRAAALALSLALAPGGLRAQQSRSSGVPRETGQFTIGGVVVWVRVTDDGTVLVYAARGYRSAFIHPASISADDAERWAAAAARLMAADSGGTTTRSRPGATTHPDTTGVRLNLGGGDVLVETELDGNAPMLIAQVGVHEPDKQVIRMPAMALQPVISTLRESAKVAKSVQTAANAAPVPAAPTTVPTAAALPAVAAAPRDSAGRARTARPASTTPQRLWRADTAVAATSVRTVSAPVPAPAQSLPPLPTEPKRPKTPAAEAHIGAVEGAPDSRIAYAGRPAEAPSVDSSQVKAPPIRSDSIPEASQPKSSQPKSSQPKPNEPKANETKPNEPKPKGAVASSDPVVSAATSRAARDSSTAGVSSAAAGTDSIAERALTTAGRLAPSALGDALRQREQLLQFCYTEYGLRVDPNLAGQIVVRIVIQQTGTVSDVTIAHRSWSGRAADEVESCIRKRVASWQFPSAERASTHEIQLIFGR